MEKTPSAGGAICPLCRDDRSLETAPPSRPLNFIGGFPSGRPSSPPRPCYCPALVLRVDLFFCLYTNRMCVDSPRLWSTPLFAPPTRSLSECRRRKQRGSRGPDAGHSLGVLEIEPRRIKVWGLPRDKVAVIISNHGKRNSDRPSRRFFVNARHSWSWVHPDGSAITLRFSRY